MATNEEVMRALGISSEQQARIEAKQNEIAAQLKKRPEYAHDRVFNQVLPFGWKKERSPSDGCAWSSGEGLDRLFVIGTIECHDGKFWAHLSCSRIDRLPSWDDLKLMRNVFLGNTKKAVQILPPEAEHVNIYSNVLHLYHGLDGDGLPDFTGGTGSL